MEKIISLDQAVEKIKDGMIIAIGGFMGCGAPHSLIDKILEKGVKDLTIITTDTGTMDYGSGKLIVNKRVKKVIASHIGTNPETGRQMNSSEIEVELVPQGTLAERLRAAGAGLGGVLTATGLGTMVEDGKEIINVDGKDYILEKPLHADIALVTAKWVDENGNASYHASARNFNPIMCPAADLVIMEAQEDILEAGKLDPDHIVTPYIFVDYIVKGESDEY